MACLLRFAFLAGLGVWVGEVVFFSFVIAPSLFQTLPAESAGRALAAIFPRYYRLGLGAGAIAFFSAIGLGMLSRRRTRWLAVAAVVVLMVGMSGYAAAVILPQTDALRPHLAHGPEPDEAAQAEFERLHRQAVALNAATLLCGMGLLGVAAAALRPS
jgi:predicted cobalt transporter CbtA